MATSVARVSSLWKRSPSPMTCFSGRTGPQRGLFRYSRCRAARDNARMIGHMLVHGFNRDKDFGFPHKWAAQLNLTRECFIGLGAEP